MWLLAYMEAFEHFLAAETPRDCYRAREAMLSLLPPGVERAEADRLAACESAGVAV